MLAIVLSYIRVYSSVFLIFSALFLNGLVIFHYFFKTRNKSLLVGGGMTVGVLVLILLMETLSYVFKGPLAITIIFILYTFICLVILRRKRGDVRKLLIINRSPRNLLQILVIALFLIIFFLFSRGSPTGGDASTHWAIATSFARGNYPTVLPSQPDYLTAYHHGAFVAEGALHAVARVNISIIHYFFSTYVISSLFLFVLGMAREETRSIFGFIPAILVTVVFGGPVIFAGSIPTFIVNFTNMAKNMPVNFEDMVLSLGTSANSVDALYYFNFYSLGLVSLLIVIYTTLFFSTKYFLKKYIILIFLLVLTLSVAEVFFIPELVIVAVSYLIEGRKVSIKKYILRSIILAVLFLLLFFTLQNMVRDSIVSTNINNTWSPVTDFMSSDFRERISYMKQRSVDLGGGISWFLPDLRLLIIIVFLLSLIYRSRYGLLFSLISLICIISSFLFVNAFWRPASLRFINQAYHMLFFAIGFLVISIYQSRKKYSKLVFTVFLLLLVPQILVRNYKFFYRAITRNDDNLVRFVYNKPVTLDWIEKNIPFKKRIIFIDEYPVMLSSFTHDAMVYHGIFVPTGPVNYKMVSIDYAGEWYDAVTKLSPRALRELKVDYIFVKNKSTEKFSEKRVQQLQNRDLFYPLYSNGEGTFYEVKDSYKNLADEEITLTKISEMIPDGEIVYIDKLPIPDARKSLLLLLANRTKLLGPLPSIGRDYFFYIETDLPIIRTDIKNVENIVPELHTIDYAITGDKINPNESLEGRFVKLAEIPYVVLWQNVEKEATE